jgi:hypothetical protein
VRYETPDRDGETRRQRNERFGVGEKNPVLCPPRYGSHLLEWFWDASETRRYEQGAPQQITPLEWAAWADAAGHLLTRDDYLILKKIDAAFVAAVAAERADQAARESA